jgi:hypothetical protein
MRILKLGVKRKNIPKNRHTFNSFKGIEFLYKLLEIKYNYLNYRKVQ